jgi:hypothetical protein
MTVAEHSATVCYYVGKLLPLSFSAKAYANSLDLPSGADPTDGIHSATALHLFEELRTCRVDTGMTANSATVYCSCSKLLASLDT